jgi:oxygen-independent coproporphyrinogen-3 oxidase
MTPAVASQTSAPDAGTLARYRVLADDGIELSLLRVVGTTTPTTPVLLTHGTFSNAGICSRLAGYLARAGLDAWILELRGHGASQRSGFPPSFEAFGLLDVPAALTAVRERTGQRTVFLVGHSGGGLAFLMHLARRLDARADVAGLVLLASQATDACATLGGQLMVHFGRVADAILGYSPGRPLGLGPENEPRGVLAEWYGWNRHRRWIGRDGFDYLAALGDLAVPTLCLAGAGDRFIAPPRGCLRLFDAIGARDKAWVLCGRAQGFSDDFGHARIIASRAAQHEVWPRIRDWLAFRLERQAGDGDREHP